MAAHPKSHLWPFVPSGRIVDVVKAEGSWLQLADGTRILDAAGGAIAASIGHGRREVADAMADAVADTGYIVPTFLTPQREKLVERLTSSWLPAHLTRVHLSSGGSEAADAAIRLARMHHIANGDDTRWKIIGRTPSYHGATALTLAAGGHTARQKGFEPYAPDLPKVPAPYALRSPLGRDHADEDLRCAKALEDTILSEGPETVAAFLAESITGSSGGALQPGPRYWPEVQRICRKHGVLLIVDEVMTGFGRTGARFGSEHFDIKADIMFAGKGLSGGYAPIAGIYATEEVVAPLAARGDSLMFYTYGGHPGACAAADKVLEIIEREALVERAATQGTKLQGLLQERLGQHPHVAEIRGRGLLWGIELVADRDTLEHFPTNAGITNGVVAHGLREGAFFYPGGTGEVRDVICLGPAFTVSDDELEMMADRLLSAINAATAHKAAA
ncbi:aminotransferase class III-fold pyridoxal phosphate-dependent enzyme [Pyruvatibacter sp.]|uniref:aminotransferase family protein n=1 Tax=Pyruvatibacter sp. TaxID=1981328 RepID=UPI003264891E